MCLPEGHTVNTMALDPHINPQSGVWDDNYYASTHPAGVSGASNSGGFNPQDIIKSAQQIQDFYKQQNQPVIAATEASKVPLKQRYDDLLNSIKGNQTTSENRQILTTNNELGRRGITGSSGLGQQEITSAVNPITQQYTGLIKDTTGQENIDIANIDKAIASLQAGNPESAISTSTGLASAATTASQRQAEIDAAAKQQAIDNALKLSSAKSRYISVGSGGLLDTETGQVLGGIKPAAQGGTGGGGIIDELQKLLNS